MPQGKFCQQWRFFCIIWGIIVLFEVFFVMFGIFIVIFFFVGENRRGNCVFFLSGFLFLVSAILILSYLKNLLCKLSIKSQNTSGFKRRTTRNAVHSKSVYCITVIASQNDQNILLTFGCIKSTFV
jgi:hypothetical protein